MAAAAAMEELVEVVEDTVEDLTELELLELLELVAEHPTPNHAHQNSATNWEADCGTTVRF